MTGLIILLLIYFIPIIVGYSKNNVLAIFILNLLFGWTFIGWGLALVWSVTND